MAAKRGGTSAGVGFRSSGLRGEGHKRRYELGWRGLRPCDREVPRGRVQEVSRHRLGPGQVGAATLEPPELCLACQVKPI